MREVPGAGLINEDLHADDFTTIDLTVSYRASETLTWQLLLLNASDEAQSCRIGPLVRGQTGPGHL